MQLLARGNANVCFHENGVVYRICVKYNCVSQNNGFVRKNYNFIKQELEVVLPDISTYICPMDIRIVEIDDFWACFLSEEEITTDEAMMTVITMPHLHCYDHRTIELDHFNKLHVKDHFDVITWEFKPKWLYQTTDYCRNCTHNTWKNRRLSYCFAQGTKTIVETLFQGFEGPDLFLDDVSDFLNSDLSILRILYEAQKAVDTNLSIAMTLRDVTCFLRWSKNEPIEVKLVDLDMKPVEKMNHWLTTEASLKSFKEKTPQHSVAHG